MEQPAVRAGKPSKAPTGLREKVYRLLNPTGRIDAVERLGDLAIGSLILANVVAVVLESMSSVERSAAFIHFETFSVMVFTLEYVLRVWSIVESRRFAAPLRGRVRFVLTPMALLDLLVILPWYLPTVTVDLRFVRVIRLIRMLRVLKFARYSHSLRTFASVFQEKRTDLTVVLVFLGVLVVLASSLMYMVENPAQPDLFSSIPAAMWWSVATLTTVGYGDIYPITPLGKFIGAFIALIGIGFFALPAGLLASAFADSVAKRRAARRPRACPHCGQALE